MHHMPEITKEGRRIKKSWLEECCIHRMWNPEHIRHHLENHGWKYTPVNALSFTDYLHANFPKATLTHRR